jgi:hypothetical protein
VAILYAIILLQNVNKNHASLQTNKNIKWGAMKHRPQFWSLGWRRANSETDPLRSVF